MDSIYQPIKLTLPCLVEISTGKKSRVLYQLNLDMFRPDYKPRLKQDEMERLREKYLKNRIEQVKDSIKGD
jgi:hypothetical protein